MLHLSFVLALAMLFACAFAAPVSNRQEKITNLQCTSKTALDFHSVNVAQLQICGGIAGTIEKCQGAPTSTTGQSGNALFSITPATKGATINISKGRWEQGIKAAFAQCGQDIPFTATFVGGASTGDVNVSLTQV